MKEFQWSRIKYGDRVVPQIGAKNVIIQNVNNGKVVKITKEAFDTIDAMIHAGWSVEEVLNQCETEKDKEYLLENLAYLAENEVVRDINDFSEYQEMPIRIDWDITNRCNLKCKHCCVSADFQNHDLEQEALLEVAEKIVSLNPVVIVISGGEPLVRKDFREIITTIKKKYQGKLFLMTNAVLIDGEMARFIAENFSSVSVSLDGVDEETCSTIRGKGVYAITIAGIRQLLEEGMTQISASMVITKTTYKYKYRFIDMCREMHIEPFLRSLSLVGRAEVKMQDMIPSEQEEIECMPIPELEKNEMEKEPEKEGAKKIGKVPTFSCGAAFRQFQIDYCGNIYPCQSLMEKELLLGNVLEIEELNDYIRNRSFVTTKGYKTLEQYFPYNFSECRGCNKQIFCWNCIEPIYREKTKREDCSMANCALDRFWE